MKSPLLHLAISILLTGASLSRSTAAEATATTAVAPAIPLRTPDGFAVPQPGYTFSFPRDHGAHPDFRIEWWYLTGHLKSDTGRPFGVQATFFRSAAPDHSGDLFLAHMAVLDVETGTFLHQERLNRPGWDAFAREESLNLRNGSWTLQMTDPIAERMKLRGGVRAEALFDLALQPAKPLVKFGEAGYSRKGDDPTAASYYLTFTRLSTQGSLTLGESTWNVTGELWMDHEISSSQLSAGQVGWDWVSVHLQDGRELMLYRLRLRDGSSDPASRLFWVDRNSQTTTADFRWTVETTWQSPKTKANYPARVRISTVDPETKQPVELIVVPLAPAQELTGDLGGIPYWEGACRVITPDGTELGKAYMELTGYAEDLRI